MIPFPVTQRAAVDRVVAKVDSAHRGLALREVLDRHRIQIGALVTVNPELTQLAVEVADAANVPRAETDTLRRFLEMLSVYGNADLRAELQPVVSALTAR